MLLQYDEIGREGPLKFMISTARLSVFRSDIMSTRGLETRRGAGKAPAGYPSNYMLNNIGA